jgi:hypothetical protein
MTRRIQTFREAVLPEYLEATFVRYATHLQPHTHRAMQNIRGGTARGTARPAPNHAAEDVLLEQVAWKRGSNRCARLRERQANGAKQSAEKDGSIPRQTRGDIERRSSFCDPECVSRR